MDNNGGGESKAGDHPRMRQSSFRSEMTNEAFRYCKLSKRMLRILFTYLNPVVGADKPGPFQKESHLP